MYMIKDVFNVPKISITHFRQKLKLRSFAFARQYSNCISLSIFDTDVVVHTNSLRSIKYSDV